MQYSKIDRNQSWGNLKGRSYSPSTLRPKNNIFNNNNSVHSDHLWNMLEDVDLFPE